MGGISTQIESDSLVDLLEKVAEWIQGLEVYPMGLDGATLAFKNRGKYVQVGKGGIETTVATKYGKKPTKRFMLMLHAHT